MDKEEFFYLKPDRELHDFIMQCKHKAKKLCGTQQYLDDTPHLTLYVNKFDNRAKVIDIINTIKLPDPQIFIKGWTTFFNDPITNGNSLVLEISNASLEKLQHFQMELINKTVAYQSRQKLSRYSNTETYSNEMKLALEKYGFPFAGPHWRAHFTIASFKKDDYTKVWHELKKMKIPTEGKLHSLSYSEIHPNNKFIPIAMKEF